MAASTFLIAALAVGSQIWTVAELLASEFVHFQVEEFSIPVPLTSVPGNAARGERIVRDASNATCLICHDIPIPGEPDPGNIGPSLDGVGSQYTAGELRLRLVAPKALNPDTVMPSYYKIEGLNRVGEEFRGKSIYDAQEIEDVIAYLLTLTEK